ncbi:MAG: hypothetical protein AAF960_28150 [Bacteroidota bacterium]
MRSFLIGCLLLTALNVFGQNNFNDCTAPFINATALIDDYSPRSQSIIDQDATGDLAIYTVNLSEKAMTPKQKIDFKIAIKDATTKTIWSYSEKTYQSIPAQEVLAQCKKDDVIMLITVDKSYALPHGEILVK